MNPLLVYLNKARPHTVPVIILVASWISLSCVSGLNSSSKELLALSPYLAAVTGMMLAIHFHRGRPFLILLMITVFYWCCRTFLAAGLATAHQQDLFNSFCIIAPVNLFLINLVRERGVFTDSGRRRVLYLALEALLAWVVFRHDLFELRPILATTLFEVPFLDMVNVVSISLILFALSGIALLVLAYRRKTPLECFAPGVLVALFVSCNFINLPLATPIFCSAACMIIIAGLLQESYHLAFTDELTGLPSRRALNEALNGLGKGFAIAMLDVDHFKKFNDTHGHDVGDQVLRLVAAKMARVGGGGKAYRYGGEEFTILYPHLDASGAVPFLDELRKEIAGYRLLIRSKDRPKTEKQGKKKRSGAQTGEYVAVTVSIGVAMTVQGAQSPESVIKAADRALYQAKGNGRNQVCVA